MGTQLDLKSDSKSIMCGQNEQVMDADYWYELIEAGRDRSARARERSHGRWDVETAWLWMEKRRHRNVLDGAA